MSTLAHYIKLIIIKYKVESTVLFGELVIIAILFQFLVHVCIQHLRQWTQTHMTSELIGNIYSNIIISERKNSFAKGAKVRSYIIWLLEH